MRRQHTHTGDTNSDDEFRSFSDEESEELNLEASNNAQAISVASGQGTQTSASLPALPNSHQWFYAWLERRGCAEAAHSTWIPRLLVAALQCKRDDIILWLGEYIRAANFGVPLCNELLRCCIPRGAQGVIERLLEKIAGNDGKCEVAYEQGPLWEGLTGILQNEDQVVQLQIAKCMERLAYSPVLSLTKPKDSTGNQVHKSLTCKLYQLLYRESDQGSTIKLPGDIKGVLKNVLFALLSHDYSYEYTVTISAKQPTDNDNNTERECVCYYGNTTMVAALHKDKSFFKDLAEHKAKLMFQGNSEYGAQITQQLYEVSPINSQNAQHKIATSAFIASSNEEELALYIVDNYRASNRVIEQADSSGRSALWYAYCNNMPKLAQKLQDLGVGYGNAMHNNGCNMLMASCFAVNRGAVQRFLPSSEMGAVDSQGNTALHYAVTSTRLLNTQNPELESAASDIIKLLIANEHNINAQNNAGATPLIHAVRNSNIAVVKAILKLQCYVNVNHQDKYGNTALMHAVLTGNPAMIRLLATDHRTNLRLINDRGLDASTMLLTLNYNNISSENRSNSLNVSPSSGAQLDSDAVVVDDSTWGRISEWMRWGRQWVVDKFMAHEISPVPSMDNAIIDPSLRSLIKLFLERGADPGSSYGSNITNMLPSLSVPGLIHYLAPKLISWATLLPQAISERIIWYVNALYCVRPTVANAVSNFAKRVYGTDQNASNLMQVPDDTEIGLYHLNWFGGVQHQEITDDSMEDAIGKFAVHHATMYPKLIAKYLYMQRDKWSMNYDGQWGNILFKIITAPWRFYYISQLQSKLVEIARSGITRAYAGANIMVSCESREGLMLARCLEHSLLDNVLMTRMANDANLQRVIQSILEYRVPVSPDLYELVWRFNEAVRTKYHQRKYGMIKYLWISAQLFIRELIFDPVDVELVSGGISEWGPSVLSIQAEAESVYHREPPSDSGIEQESALNAGCISRTHIEGLHGFYNEKNWLKSLLPESFDTKANPERIGQFAGLIAMHGYLFLCHAKEMVGVRENALVFLGVTWTVCAYGWQLALATLPVVAVLGAAGAIALAAGGRRETSATEAETSRVVSVVDEDREALKTVVGVENIGPYSPPRVDVQVTVRAEVAVERATTQGAHPYYQNLVADHRVGHVEAQVRSIESV